MEYANYPTYGSVAYDLGSPKFENPTLEEPRFVGLAVPRARTETAVRAEHRNYFSPLIAAGLAAAAVLIVLTLLAYVQLTAVTSGTVRMQNRLEELSSEYSKLKAEYETTFNLTEIELYATKTLGMTHAAQEQTLSVENMKTDRAVVLDTKDAGGGVGEFISSLLEFFQ